MAAESCKTRHPWFKYREIHDALARLSDRDLADIGVKRGDIPLIARRGAGIATDVAAQGQQRLVQLVGLEPTTYGSTIRRSTN